MQIAKMKGGSEKGERIEDRENLAARERRERDLPPH